MRQVNETDRKYFHAFVREFPEYSPLLNQWVAAKLLVTENPHEEYRLAEKIYNLMKLNGWG
ncbi:hypothetical protein BVG16_15795 [Paenibacillus selenitireducens]|uniref:Uncharacterized protein n=1 Tax=Paenibacillus selenitireducens TaxID=1324314 RepID=A0A1T2XA03_9BACL|nr:hypothetical protein [Paenibacillus selenitireducens]OPA76642.1 hypothetical protein BVG16_15795 [Paenibacillus selenitireducens]